MSKCKETIELEALLHKNTRENRCYGCEEVSIGFSNSGYAGRGPEIVDFMTMDSKGIIKCYEIKVTLSDLKSNAKKSWLGHYNYLVVSDELYEKLDGNFESYIPSYVGIVTKGHEKWNKEGIEVRKRAKKQNVDSQMEILLKESLVRSLYWRMDKYRAESDPDKEKRRKEKMKELQKERDNYYHLYTVFSDYVMQYKILGPKPVKK